MFGYYDYLPIKNIRLSKTKWRTKGWHSQRTNKHNEVNAVILMPIWEIVSVLKNNFNQTQRQIIPWAWSK